MQSNSCPCPHIRHNNNKNSKCFPTVLNRTIISSPDAQMSCLETYFSTLMSNTGANEFVLRNDDARASPSFLSKTTNKLNGSPLCVVGRLSLKEATITTPSCGPPNCPRRILSAENLIKSCNRHQSFDKDEQQKELSSSSHHTLNNDRRYLGPYYSHMCNDEDVEVDTVSTVCSVSSQSNSSPISRHYRDQPPPPPPTTSSPPRTERRTRNRNGTPLSFSSKRSHSDDGGKLATTNIDLRWTTGCHFKDATI